MGNKLYSKNDIRCQTPLKFFKNINPAEIATQTIPAQTMQSNRYQCRFSCQPNVKKPVLNVTPVLTEDSVNYDMKEKPADYNDSIKYYFPLGMHMKEDLYQYNFWAPESSITMKDFVEIHSIPIYELKNKNNFAKYCNEKEWFHSSHKFKRFWNSVRTNNSRLICGVKSKFGVSIKISDCFFDENGSSMRAYGIVGGDHTSVVKAFSYMCDTWRPNFFRDTRWHHDSIFYCDSSFSKEPTKRKVDLCGNPLDDMQLDDAFVVDDFNNDNAMDNPAGVCRQGVSDLNKNCLIVTFPKNDQIDPRLMNDGDLLYETIHNGLFEAVTIRSPSSSKLETYKLKLKRHLEKKYSLSEKLIHI